CRRRTRVAGWMRLSTGSAAHTRNVPRPARLRHGGRRTPRLPLQNSHRAIFHLRRLGRNSKRISSPLDMYVNIYYETRPYIEVNCGCSVLQATNRSHTCFASSRLLAVISASSSNSNCRSFIKTLPAQIVVVTIEFSNPNKMCHGRLSVLSGVVG